MSATWPMAGSSASGCAVCSSSAAQPFRSTPAPCASHHTAARPPAQNANAGVRMRGIHSLASSRPGPTRRGQHGRASVLERGSWNPVRRAEGNRVPHVLPNEVFVLFRTLEEDAERSDLEGRPARRSKRIGRVGRVRAASTRASRHQTPARRPAAHRLLRVAALGQRRSPLRQERAHLRRRSRAGALREAAPRAALFLLVHLLLPYPRSFLGTHSARNAPQDWIPRRSRASGSRSATSRMNAAATDPSNHSRPLPPRAAKRGASRRSSCRAATAELPEAPAAATASPTASSGRPSAISMAVAMFGISGPHRSDHACDACLQESGGDAITSSGSDVPGHRGLAG